MNNSHPFPAAQYRMAVKNAALVEFAKLGIEPTEEELERISKGSPNAKAFYWHLLEVKREREAHWSWSI